MKNDLRIYDNVAASWWSDDIRWVRTLKNLVPARLKYFKNHIDFSGKRVLDLGCAGGFMSEALCAKGAKVFGIDPAAEAIAAARQHAFDGGLPIQYDVEIGEDLPYEDDFFDAVVCVDVLEHVADLPKVISEIARVTKRDGVFCFDTINNNALAAFVTVTMAEHVLRIHPQGTHDPSLFIKPKSLEELLAENGFDECRMAGLGPVGLNKRLDFVFGQLPITFVMYMGVATLRRP